MLLLAASHIKFIYVYNYSFKIQVFLMLKLFQNIEIHIIHLYHTFKSISVFQ